MGGRGGSGAEVASSTSNSDTSVSLIECATSLTDRSSDYNY